MEKVREDVAVRNKISQSSALRQKRRPQDFEGQKPEILEAKPKLALNNNGPCSLKEEEVVLAQANGTMGEPGRMCYEQQQLKGINPETKKAVEEIVSPDSLSEVSKFESEFTSSELSLMSVMSLGALEKHCLTENEDVL